MPQRNVLTSLQQKKLTEPFILSDTTKIGSTTWGKLKYYIKENSYRTSSWFVSESNLFYNCFKISWIYRLWRRKRSRNLNQPKWHKVTWINSAVASSMLQPFATQGCNLNITQNKLKFQKDTDSSQTYPVSSIEQHPLSQGKLLLYIWNQKSEQFVLKKKYR